MKEIDWSNLSFGYMPTDYNVRCYYRNGEWGEVEVCSEATINIHMAATCLHYGQEAFEGLKAYRCPDGKVRVFRMDENAARLQSTCRGILMPELPTERFEEMVEKVVRLNERFIPPYESGATLYIRPLLIGTGAQVGVHPANEYLFVLDEMHQIGYLATDRFAAEGRVHVYSFAIPQQKQYWRNIATDSLVAYARLEAFELVKTDSLPLTEHIEIAENTDEIGDFCLIINDSVVYHALGDFHQSAAKEKYQEWQKAHKQYLSEQQQLATLRQQYAVADEAIKKELTPVILQLEENQSLLFLQCEKLLLTIRQIENQSTQE
jgi:hypothetical protein